jgi:4-hydroxyphenylpyruvate dioxygenase
MTFTERKSVQLQEDDLVTLKRIDYVEFYVGNARQAAHFYCTAFGFTPIAYAGLETGVRDRCSFVLEQSNIRLVFTSALTPDSPIAKQVKLHGDGVHDIALLVDDARAAFKATVARGARPVLEPTITEEPEGHFVKATIASYGGDITHSFIERNNYTGFAPQYHSTQNPPPVTPTGLTDIDHIVINVESGRMEAWTDFYQTVMGFRQLEKFANDYTSTEYSAMRTKVLRNSTSRIKFAINEPAQGHHQSQIQEYIDFYRGPGVQHFAMITNDIITTVQHLRSNGVEFLHTPDTYYDNLHQRIGQIDEDINVLRDLKILIDRDDEGYLLQIFTKPLTARPTVFGEIIQRQGAQGFGQGNFKALFEAIELEQVARGSL